MKKRLFDIFIILTLVAGAFISYSNTFDASFHYDDYPSIVSNAYVHMEELGLAAMSIHPTENTSDRPIAYMSFALNYYFGGLDVFGYHLVNIIIHILTGIGVYFLVKVTMGIDNRMGVWPYAPTGENKKNAAIAVLAALLWLLSPVQTQAVTYIVQRMASMAAMFYVWSFLFYIKGRTSGGGKRWGYLALSLTLFLHAIATKQNTITMPLMVALYEVAFFRKGSLNIFREKWFYISVLACVSVAGGYLYLFRESFDLTAYFSMGYGIRERLFTEARVITGHYIPAMFFPIPSRLALIHDFPLSRGLLSPFTTLTSILFIAGAMALSLYRLRKAPVISFFALWFFINLIPESIFVGLDLIYEHRLYLPSIGFYAVVASVAVRMWEGRGWRALFALFALVLVFFSANTYLRNRDWHSELSLWSDNVRKAPYSSVSHEALGSVYLAEGEMEKAGREFETARGLNPLSPLAGIGLAIIAYERTGELEGFEYLVKGQSLGAGTHYEMGGIFSKIGEDLMQKGRGRDAVRVIRAGLALYPGNIKLKEALQMAEKLEEGKDGY